MIRKMLGMMLIACMLWVPAAAEREELNLLFQLTGKLIGMLNQENQPDPYLWLYEQETRAASIDDVSAVAQLLRDLGIEDITQQVEDSYRQMTEEVIQLMTQHGNEYTVSLEEMTLGLLYTAGSVQTDKEGCVYAFDAEVYDVSTMYRDFLTGIERIGNGELRFERIIEDLSGVDWDTGDGTRTVTFDFRGRTLTYHALAQHDWFDMGMLEFLHDAIGMGESGRQLYFLLDGMQGVILFYQTPQWAQEFTKATGCPLFTNL